MLLQLRYRLPKIDAGAGRGNNKWILIFRSTKLYNCHTECNPKKKNLWMLTDLGHIQLPPVAWGQNYRRLLRAPGSVIDF